MKILLAIDDATCSAAATRAIIFQFIPSHTQVHVLHADDCPRGMPSLMTLTERSVAARIRRGRASQLLESTAKRPRSAGFTTDASLRDGDPRETIVDCARKWEADLIVLGSHGNPGFNETLGSVSDSVTRHAPCSVEIVQPAPTPAAMHS